MTARLVCLLLAFALALPAGAGSPSREDYLKLAKAGWVFDTRSSVMRNPGREVRTDSRAMVGAALCILGRPSPLSRDLIARFRDLLAEIYGATGAVETALEAADCPDARIHLRLFDEVPPLRAFNADLAWLDAEHGIGLPRGRLQPIRSPAQAVTWFARDGTVSYLVVKQAPDRPLLDTEARFYASILVEEMLQTMTFGMDVLVFDRAARFLSKLQEKPTNLSGYTWEDPRFMEGLLASNPSGICAFDILMMHALASTRAETANSQAFLDGLAESFDDLAARTRATLAQARFQPLMDPDCAPLPE